MKPANTWNDDHDHSVKSDKNEEEDCIVSYHSLLYLKYTKYCLQKQTDAQSWTNSKSDLFLFTLGVAIGLYIGT